jgi:anti-sigma B factor antagonist
MGEMLLSALNIDVVEADQGPLHLRVSGDFDHAGSEAFRGSLDRVLGLGRPIVVDLTGVDFIDSSGLGALLDAHRRAVRHGIKLRIAGEHGGVARLMHRTGTLTMLTHR